MFEYGGIMAGRIIGLIACIMCALPFFIIAAYGKDSEEPIAFWSGDTTLKAKVKNVSEYNKKMASLYKKYAVSFLIAGVSLLIIPIVGIIVLCVSCSLGIYILYRCYKKILKTYS